MIVLPLIVMVASASAQTFFGAPAPSAEKVAGQSASPETAPTPESDPLDWLLKHRNLWPQEVALLEASDFPVVISGKVAGSAKVPAGTLVTLIDVGGETVDVRFRGGLARLPVDSTDLRKRAAALAMTKAATEPPKQETSPALQSATPQFASSTSTLQKVQKVDRILNRMVTLDGATAVHVTGEGDPLANSSINFTSPDAWLFLEKISPSKVASSYLNQMSINGQRAVLGQNTRVVAYGSGSVVIPHGPSFGAMTVFSGESFSGSSKSLECYVPYDDARLGDMKKSIRSFLLKRGYMATIAQEENGRGVSRNYVAQDHDVEIKSLPPELDRNVRFVRIFPWRWTSKKGVAGGIWQNLNVGWYYNWNITDNSSLDVEYVPIRQNRWWPGLDQNWKDRGSTHLLGYNEPDRSDQAKMSVDDAIAGWPDLLATGLRVGSPAPSDGGLGWLAEFMKKAEAANLRVDFVAVHYYRAVNPRDATAAASQFYRYLKDIHDRYKRPIWITEWNNGANWTNAGDPTPSQQKAAIREMIKMLDETPFVERYAIYNWVEKVRHVQDDNGSLTPAGKIYRDQESPPGYIQVEYK